MRMNVAVIGSGGREHALCDALHKSPTVHTIYAIPGNPGMASIATCISIDLDDFTELITFCKRQDIMLVIPGSEVYLEQGIVDAFKDTNIRVFGPTKKAAQIESSKTFAKELMNHYNIPTASYQVFTSYKDAWDYVCKQSLPIVIKYDGLAGGKGVVIATSLEEAKDALTLMLIEHTYGYDSVVIEEYLEGPEFSLMCFVHENHVIPMPIAQDHKRLCDNDQGPNTGGMGIYSSVPIIDNSIIQQAIKTIMEPVASALVTEGTPFTGFLYGGLMNTKDGPKVIEFNARFGDPEAEVILPKLQTDIIHIIDSLYEKKPIHVLWSDEYYVGVVLASKGYPLAYDKGYPIHINGTVDSVLYHMGTTITNNQLCTNGGRVLLVTGHAKTLQKAQENAYNNINKITCHNLMYRTDIGHQSL
jgi:phosphoribosylamine--glycine ligase